MATIDYKEKYEKAVQAAMLAKQDTESAVTIGILEEIFPELRESEGERVRKEMITYFSTVEDKELIPYESWIAYLEKQGEQSAANKVEPKDYNSIDPHFGKPIDKVEPKFNVGDEIKTSNEELLTITKIDEKGYWSDDLFICGFDDAAKWELVGQKSSWSEEDNQIALSIEQVMNCASLLNIVPEKIDKIRTWLKSLKDRVCCEANCTTAKEWSEEDEKMIRGLIVICDEWTTRHSFYPIENCEIEKLKNWLESLKDRVLPQPKQEWSKEDYNDMETIACHLDNTDNEGLAEVLRNIRDKYYHIIPQSTWKPSDEQITVLELASKYERVFTPKQIDILVGLKEQLKELRGSKL